MGRPIAGSIALAVLFLSNLLAAPVGLMTNCTGGEADLAVLPVFLGGGVASALTLALLRPKRKIGFLIAVAVSPLILSVFTIGEIALGWFGRGSTACQTLTGLPFPPDGNEALTPYMLATIALIVLLCVMSRMPRRN